jgi:Holliday junction resolvase
MRKKYVINSRGEKEPFSKKKVFNSCRRSGASRKLAEEISKKIQKTIYSGIETSEIFRLVKLLLSENSPELVMRVSLREAMRKLGPSGFDFEKYIAKIFYKNGFEVTLNVHVPGLCISSYEIDFLAKKRKLVYLGECKYHRGVGDRVDLKIALADYARFLDIKKGEYFKGYTLRNIIVTNAKFTSELVKYSRCTGTELLGWRYPRRKGLERFIEKSKLYPITVLPSLKGYLKKTFAEKGIILIQDLLDVDAEMLAESLKLQKEEVENLVSEAKMLLE